MTDPFTPQAHPPELAPALLHAPARGELHADSEDHVQFERQRVSRELQPIYQGNGQTRTPSFASLRSRNATSRDCNASHERLQRSATTESDVRTQQDVPEPNENMVQRVLSSASAPPRWHDPITRFWKTHISLTIDEGAHRDHLALERTYFSYLRTSLTFVMTGVLIAQLFRLQRSPNPNPEFGFFIIGRPLSITFISMGLVVVLFGAFRFWNLQQGLVRGKAYAGGLGLLLVVGLSILLLFATFALVLGVNIDKAYFGSTRS